MLQFWCFVLTSLRGRGVRVAVLMSSASALGKRAARFARASFGFGGRSVGVEAAETLHFAGWKQSGRGFSHRPATHLTHRPWRVVDTQTLVQIHTHTTTTWRRGISSTSIWKQTNGDSSGTGASDSGNNTGGTDAHVKHNLSSQKTNPQTQNQPADPRADSTSVPGQSRIVRVANFVARDILSSKTNAELLGKMYQHRDMAYLVATREASPFPFVFQSGCKFYENGIFEGHGGDIGEGQDTRRTVEGSESTDGGVGTSSNGSNDPNGLNPLCGPCDAAGANAHRLREDENANPIACTLTPRECFKTQQYAYFAVWMFFCYAGFVVILKSVRVVSGFVATEIEKYDTRAEAASTRERALSLAESDAGNTNQTSDENKMENQNRAARDTLPTKIPPAAPYVPIKQTLRLYDPLGTSGLNFQTPYETWCALIAATLNFSRSVEIVRTTFLMFAFRKLAWRLVSVATNFKRHRRWM